MFISAPDIHSASDLPYLDFLIAVPALFLLSWLAVVVFGRISLLFYYFFLALGLYGFWYGVAELASRFMRHQPALSSVGIVLFGVTVVGSLLLSGWLLAHRLSNA